MITPLDRAAERSRIHLRIRKKISGSAQRPRLCVYRSTKHIYAQIVDDSVGKTIVAASTVESTILGGSKATGNIAAAKTVGKAIADRAKAKGIGTVVFDRGGYIYHGRVKALAEAAREAGLRF